MKRNKMVFSIVTAVCLMPSFLFFLPVQAETVGDVQLVNPLGGTDEKPEGVTNISVLLGNVISQVLKILGSLTLVAFVVGGFLWLTSAGNAEKIKQGMNTMLYAVIGLFIIFGGYAILSTVLNGLGVSGVGTSDTSGKCVAGSKTIVDWCNESVKEGDLCDDSVCEIINDACVPREGKTTEAICREMIDKDSCQEFGKDGYCKFISSN